MKRTRFIALMFNFYSVSTVAGHLCNIKLAHIEDLYKTVAEKSVITEYGTLASRNLGPILVENVKAGRKKLKKETRIDVHAVVNGFDNEQESNFVFIRKEFKNERRTSWDSLGPVFTLKGNDSGTFWFDDYKAEISCSAKNEKIQ